MPTDQTQSNRAIGSGAMSSYLRLAHQQFEANLAMASVWAAAMSAASGSMLSQSKPVAGRAAPAAFGTGRVFRLISVPADPGTEQSRTPYWTASDNPAPSWPRWINESPTVQPDLFDEAIELLVDDDIKTAS